MKMFQSAKLFTGLSLVAGLFWGCQDLLSQKDGSAQEPETVATDESALRLSIKDDSACRDQWDVILAARTAGLADSAAEKSFLANCVTEIKPGKGKLPPVIPPHLQPDSASRCHWIVSQIDGGRDEMTVSYKRYCPEDCRKLEDADSTRHAHLCRDPHGPAMPPKPPKDTLPKPPIDTTKPKPPVDSCKIARDSLAKVDSASSEAASLRQYLLARCGKPPRPDDSLPKPPKDTLPKPPKDSIVKPPKDTLPKPPIDTTKPKPPVDSCKIARDSLAKVDSASAEALSLSRFLMEHCGKPPRPDDSLPKPPKDTLPKPIPVKPAPECDALRAKLLKLEPASEESKLLVETILEHCPEAKP